jgi:hypothetical protein
MVLMGMRKISKQQLERMVRESNYAHSVRAMMAGVGIVKVFPDQCSCRLEEFYDYKVRIIRRYYGHRVTLGQMEEIYQRWGAHGAN